MEKFRSRWDGRIVTYTILRSIAGVTPCRATKISMSPPTRRELASARLSEQAANSLTNMILATVGSTQLWWRRWRITLRLTVLCALAAHVLAHLRTAEAPGVTLRNWRH